MCLHFVLISIYAINWVFPKKRYSAKNNNFWKNVEQLPEKNSLKVQLDWLSMKTLPKLMSIMANVAYKLVKGLLRNRVFSGLHTEKKRPIWNFFW